MACFAKETVDHNKTAHVAASNRLKENAFRANSQPASVHFHLYSHVGFALRRFWAANENGRLVSSAFIASKPQIASPKLSTTAVLSSYLITVKQCCLPQRTQNAHSPMARKEPGVLIFLRNARLETFPRVLTRPPNFVKIMFRCYISFEEACVSKPVMVC